jgi:multicomponent K+:H+ antiporter subunit A
MSFVAIVGGTLLFLLLRPYFRHELEGPPLIRYLKRKRIFEQAMVILSWRWARGLEEILGTRRLQPQLRLLLGVAFLAAAAPFYVGTLVTGPMPASPVDPAFAVVWAVGMVCAIGAAWQAKYHRLAALILMGGAGLTTCITFAWLSAPDLALTQLVVEAVTTVLILLGLRWLPKRLEAIVGDTAPAARLRRFADLVIAAVLGAGLAMLAYAIMTRPPPSEGIGSFFLQRAYTEGGGANVVNVILVDFRGFDTLGEITVLGIVALTVFALLRRFRPATDNVRRPEQQRVQDARDRDDPNRREGDTIADYLTVPAVLVKLLFPVVGLLGIFLFLRGHDQPGGGFVAGLTMAIAIILQYMASGARWVEARLRVHPLRWMGLGLLLAVATGAAAWIGGLPFLTSLSADVDIPLIGKVHLSSVLLFDLGVMSLVLGATVLMLIALAHQSLRRYRPPPSPAKVAALTADAG